MEGVVGDGWWVWWAVGVVGGGCGGWWMKGVVDMVDGECSG